MQDKSEKRDILASMAQTASQRMSTAARFAKLHA